MVKYFQILLGLAEWQMYLDKHHDHDIKNNKYVKILRPIISNNLK